MKKKEYIYSNYTYNSRNPIARFAHRTRFSLAKSIVNSHNYSSILDYGAGDLNFLHTLPHKPNIELHAYEPIMKSDSTKHINLHTNTDTISSQKYDMITCFEVLEHFNIIEQNEILNFFHQILSPNGIVIISIPIEIGFPSLVKNIRRLIIGDDNDAFLKNAIKCFFKLPIRERQIHKGYHPSHIGFDYRQLEHNLANFFVIKQKTTSPFPLLSTALNSQIFYTLIKK